MQNYIQLPPDCFYQEAKREYRLSLVERLCIEFIQNSRDAFATVIEFIYDENEKSLTVNDNGVGMDEETLIQGMLSYAGSVKGANSVGGFGAAKKLLLFSHKGYEIKTWDLRVKGENIRYSLEKGHEDYRGTEIKIYLGEWWTPTLGEFKNALRKIVHYSDFSLSGRPFSVEFNGEKLVKEAKEQFQFERGLFKIYEGGAVGYNTIRFNGLIMFSYYTGSGKAYIFECAAASKDALSQNREGFNQNHQAYSEYTSLSNELTRNSSSGFTAAASVERTKNDEVTTEKGIVLRGFKGQTKLSKRQKMIFCLCRAVGEIFEKEGWSPPKMIHFYRDSNLRGLWADGKIWINSDYFEGKDWELETIEVFLHEWMHKRGYDHDERFISNFGSFWVIFLRNYSGIGPIRARMRQIEKEFFGE
jgi:hypothetical protein